MVWCYPPQHNGVLGTPPLRRAHCGRRCEMEYSMFLAKIIGWFYVVVAAGMILRPKAYRKIMEDFSNNLALVYLGGIFAMLIGLLTVFTHNIWRPDWTVIITIFAWLGLIKGVWLLLVPNTVAKITAFYLKQAPLLVFYAILIMALGIFLLVKGYFVG